MPGQAAAQAALADHNHDSDYSALVHNHDADYAALSHKTRHENGGGDELDFDELADGTTYKKLLATERTKLTGIETGADVTGDNAPKAHTLGSHTEDTLANLNAKVSDATLIDTADARLSDARTPLAHDHDEDYEALGHDHDEDYAALSHKHGRPLCGVILDPNGAYDKLTFLPLWLETDGAITISKIQISCDADPATELDVDLVFVDAFIGLANLTVIDVLDTTAGASEITTGFDDATVPSGKCIGLRFGTQPIEAINGLAYLIEFDYD